MNKLEKIIYDRVKSMPWLKYLIRNVYQTAFDLLPRQKEFIPFPLQYREGFFFGFHDLSPFSPNNDKVLANRLTIPLRMPLPGEKLDVGWFHLNHGKFGEFVKVGESDAWNYHKGCRLQWAGNDRLIYNSAMDGKLLARITDTISGEEKRINFPIDTVSPDGRLASSFSYERLHELMPGYGYPYADNGLLAENAPAATGLFLVDLEKNSRQMLLSLEQLAADAAKEYPTAINFRHYVTHTAFSADSRYLSFLHRWTGSDIRERTTRLVVYDLEKKTYQALPTDGMVSHYIWNGKNQLIAWCRLDGLDCHALFNIPETGQNRKIAPTLLNSDGHQSVINHKTFVTDTYPDRFRMAKLYKVNTENDQVQLLASLYSPKKFQTRNFKNHIACDLHPRVSPDGKMVCFDSVRTGIRSLYIMTIENS